MHPFCRPCRDSGTNRTLTPGNELPGYCLSSPWDCGAKKIGIVQSCGSRRQAGASANGRPRREWRTASFLPPIRAEIALGEDPVVFVAKRAEGLGGTFGGADDADSAGDGDDFGLAFGHRHGIEGADQEEDKRFGFSGRFFRVPLMRPRVMSSNIRHMEQAGIEAGTASRTRGLPCGHRVRLRVTGIRFSDRRQSRPKIKRPLKHVRIIPNGVFSIDLKPETPN